AVWSNSGGVTPELPRWKESVRDRYDPTEPVSKWHQQRTRKRLGYALAASTLVATVAGLSQLPVVLNLMAPSHTTVQTGIGEQQQLRLSDGSILTVGARSWVTVALTDQQRDITLQSGEAFFDVAKDAQRPFVVHAGGTEVTAVGTQFNVRRSSEQVVVSVSEGIVQVASEPGAGSNAESATAAPVQLTAGNRVNIESNGSAPAAETVDAASVGGWREGRLQYINEPLRTVLADVHRYTLRDIEIADADVGALRITGTVFSNDVDGWLRTLEMSFPVRVTIGPSGSFVLKSTQPAAPEPAAGAAVQPSRGP
ncbi:FecR family protein, partial [Steroidobacter sp.]|uniref:FecR family protein n=1 Tax=Steroidobacter sp. TaxID=1978227 RepID=UPI001A36D3AE